VSAAPETAAPPTPAHPPRGRPTIVDPRSFVFWVLVAVLIYSGIHTYSALTSPVALKVNPAIGWLGLVLWAIYGIALLAFIYYHQLFVRRSPWITLAAVLWGGIVATWFAAKANGAAADIFDHWFALDFNHRWGTAISAATNEESLKLLGVVVLFLLPLAAVRSTLDGWFYGMMVGLGFQLVEDYLYTVQQSTSLGDVGHMFFLRGFLAGAWAHAVYTGIAGAGIGYLVSRRDRSWLARIGVAVGLFAIAWGMHFFWDTPFLNEWAADSAGLSWLVILIKGVPALVILFLVIRWGRNQERKVWTAFVDDTIDRDLVSEAEAKALLDRKGRRAARKSVREAKGRAAGRLQKHLQYAQLRYIQSVSEEGAESAHAVSDASEIRELRAAIAAA